MVEWDSYNCEGGERSLFTKPVIVTSDGLDWNPSLKVTLSLCGRCVQKFKTNHQRASPLTRN